MQKEIITKEIVRKQLKSEMFRFYNPIILFLIFGFIILLLLTPVSYKNNPDDFLRVELITWVGFSLMVIIFGFPFYKRNKKIKNFKIVTDKLVGCEYFKGSNLSGIFDSFSRFFSGGDGIYGHTLNFSSYGFFNVGLRNAKGGVDYYKWSKLYSMTGEGILNTSKIGDEFYLAISDKDEILAVFNQKWFNLEQ